METMLQKMRRAAEGPTNFPSRPLFTEAANEIEILRSALNEICSLACHEPRSAEIAGRALRGERR